MKIALNSNVIIKDYEINGLLIDVERATYRKVNSSGLTISKILEVEKNIELEPLLLKLSALYKIPVDVFRHDIEEYIGDMVSRGFYTSDSPSQIEENPMESAENYSKNGVWIKVTNKCNLTCRYCYADAGTALDIELTVGEMEDLLHDLNNSGFSKFVITGGEPLMRNDIIDILEVCAKYGQVQLLTNGTMGDHNLYKKIMSLVDIIQISIDSYEMEYHDKNRGEGSFKRALSTIEYLSSVDAKKIAIAMTPTPEYKADIIKMINFCLDLNVIHLHINRFVPYGRAKSYDKNLDITDFYTWADQGYQFLRDTYNNCYRQNRKFEFDLDIATDLCEQVYSQGKKISCGLNCNHLSIESNGDVFLCPSLHIKELVLGNIKNEPISDIMNKSRSEHGSFKVDDLPKCKECEVKYYCGGGCRAIALHDSNDLYGNEYNCENYKKRIYGLMLQ